MREQVAELLRAAAEEAILPRFQALAANEIEEKTSGEVVTIADREAERIISTGLIRLLPGSRVIGEEACAARPQDLESIGEGDVWLVDPLDGTGNFVKGSPPFSTMVALLRHGETVASWMLDPLTGILSEAELGAGAMTNGERAVVSKTTPTPPSGASLTRFMPPAVAAMFDRASVSLHRVPGLLCAGAEYPAIVSGERDFAVFWRTLPWDHAPGALFLIEAGGHVCRPDGSPYRPDQNGSGLIATSCPSARDRLLNVFKPEGP